MIILDELVCRLKLFLGACFYILFLDNWYGPNNKKACVGHNRECKERVAIECDIGTMTYHFFALSIMSHTCLLVIGSILIV